MYRELEESFPPLPGYYVKIEPVLFDPNDFSSDNLEFRVRAHYEPIRYWRDE